MKLRKLCIAILFLLPALALAQSPPVTAQLSASAASCAVGASPTACLFLQVAQNIGMVTVDLEGTFSATVQFEQSSDGGNTWRAVGGFPSGGGAAVTSATAVGTWQINAGAYHYIRARVSTYSSGTVTATLTPSKSGSSASAGSAAGSVTSVTFTGDGVVDSATPSSAVTASGTVTATLNTQTANTVLAGPTSGGAVAPTFRALVANDVPTLNQNTSGTAGGLTGTPNISVGTIAASGAAAFSSTADKTGNGSISADSAGINTVETVVGVSASAMAANRLVAGTVVRITAWGTCTTTVANTSTFKVRIGTTGSTSDTTAVALITGAAGTTGTNVPFKLELEFTIRTVGSGTSGTVDARDLLFSSANGIQGATSIQVGTPTLSGFDTTTANFISLTYLSAAATTTSTFKQVIIEVVYK